MSITEIIGCAPFRLTSPRPLTAYEWNLVGAAFLQSMPTPQAIALAAAVSSQVACPGWKTSAFGPAPAVNLTWYRALGRWYGQLNAVSQTAALGDIGRGLLCGPNPPWAGFVDKTPTWEGDCQNADNSASSGVAGLEPCAPNRRRTFYTPVTGADVVAVAKMLAANPVPGLPQIPPFIVSMIQQGQLPEDFLKRTFLLGFETAAPGEKAKAIIFSEVALIWAPGQGASVADLFRPDGTIDIAKLMALLQLLAPSIAPSLIPGFMQSLPGMLPGLLQQIGGQAGSLPQMYPQAIPGMAQQMPGVFTAATQVATAVLGQQAAWPAPKPLNGLDSSVGASPHTPPTTGVPIVDGVAGGGDSGEMSLFTKVAIGSAVVAVASALALALVMRNED